MSSHLIHTNSCESGDARHAPLCNAVLVTGKGGVGKTTIAAGLAVASVRCGRPAVFVEFGDGESGRRALGDDGIDVEHVVIEPDDAVWRAGAPLFGSPVLAKLALGNFAMRKFLRAAPGLREVAMLETMRQVVEAHPGKRVVVDLPATGHGLAWLRVPTQVARIAPPGPFRRLADRLNEELLSPGHCSVVVVTLPEPLVASETVQLCRAMTLEIGLPTARLVVNRMPAPLSAQALDDAIALGAGNDKVARAARALRRTLDVRRAARSQGVEAIKDILTAEDLAPVILPLSPIDPTSGTVATWFLNEEAA